MIILKNEDRTNKSDIKSFEQIKMEQDEKRKFEVDEVIEALRNNNNKRTLFLKLLIYVSTVLIFSAIFSLITFLISNQQNDTIELSSQIEAISASLKETSIELSLIQKELELRVEFVEQLKKDAEIAEAVVNLSQEQIDSVRNLLNIEVNKNNSRNFWVNLLITLAGVIIGSIFTFFIPRIVDRLRKNKL